MKAYKVQNPLEASPVAPRSGDLEPKSQGDRRIYTAQDAGVVIATLDRVEKVINQALLRYDHQYLDVHAFARDILSKLREV